jgi:hypothetical protein
MAKPPPEIVKVILITAEGGSLGIGTAIHYKGGLWLAPAWSAPQANGLIYPNRLIRIDKLAHQKLPKNNQYGADYGLNVPLPKGLFDAEIPQELKGKFDVLEQPNIGVRPPPTVH